jgi:hypothetical protein
VLGHLVRLGPKLDLVDEDIGAQIITVRQLLHRTAQDARGRRGAAGHRCDGVVLSGGGGNNKRREGAAQTQSLTRKHGQALEERRAEDKDAGDAGQRAETAGVQSSVGRRCEMNR